MQRDWLISGKAKVKFALVLYGHLKFLPILVTAALWLGRVFFFFFFFFEQVTSWTSATEISFLPHTSQNFTFCENFCKLRIFLYSRRRSGPSLESSKLSRWKISCSAENLQLFHCGHSANLRVTRHCSINSVPLLERAKTRLPSTSDGWSFLLRRSANWNISTCPESLSKGILNSSKTKRAFRRSSTQGNTKRKRQPCHRQTLAGSLPVMSIVTERGWQFNDIWEIDSQDKMTTNLLYVSSSEIWQLISGASFIRLLWMGSFFLYCSHWKCKKLVSTMNCPPWRITVAKLAENTRRNQNAEGAQQQGICLNASSTFLESLLLLLEINPSRGLIKLSNQFFSIKQKSALHVSVEISRISKPKSCDEFRLQWCSLIRMEKSLESNDKVVNNKDKVRCTPRLKDTPVWCCQTTSPHLHKLFPQIKSFLEWAMFI